MTSRTLLFECEMSPTDFCVYGLQLMVMFGEVVIPVWSRGGGGKSQCRWALRFYSLALLPACPLLPDWLMFLSWWLSWHSIPYPSLNQESSWTFSSEICFCKLFCHKEKKLKQILWGWVHVDRISWTGMALLCSSLNTWKDDINPICPHLRTRPDFKKRVIRL